MIKTLRTALRLTLAGYHKILSPLLPPACRFYPSCSVYAAAAIEKYGIGRGGLMGLRRICRCHPFNAGGYDPVK